MSQGNMNLTLKVWRQKHSRSEGYFETHELSGISPDMSFLEMFAVLNEKLVAENKEPVAFDHDCRDGMCGMCSLYINSRPHGALKGITSSQLPMRSSHDADTTVVQRWRADAFPVITDLGVDRTSFDPIIAAGG